MFLLSTGLTTLALNTPANVSAKPKANPAPSMAAVSITAEASKKQRAVPYRGKIASVDSSAKTFTIIGKEKSRTFKITDRTTLTKADQPATIKDVVVDEEVRGSYWILADGSLEAKTIKLGPPTDAEKPVEDSRQTKRAEKRAASSSSPEQH